MFVLNPLGVLLSINQHASDLHGFCILSFGTGRQEKNLAASVAFIRESGITRRQDLAGSRQTGTPHKRSLSCGGNVRVLTKNNPGTDSKQGETSEYG